MHSFTSYSLSCFTIFRQQPWPEITEENAFAYGSVVWFPLNPYHQQVVLFKVSPPSLAFEYHLTVDYHVNTDNRVTIINYSKWKTKFSMGNR